MSATKTRKWVTRLAALLVLPVGLVGCDDSPTQADQQARVSAYLTDAPGDVESAWVIVDDVVLVGGGGNVSLLDESSDWINLLALQDEALTLTEDVSVEAGTYTQVRFVIRNAILAIEEGAIYSYGQADPPEGVEPTNTLVCPSCAQSGLKVRLPGGVELNGGEDVGILMDFDVSQSFGRQAGQSGQWVMHPVILGTATDPSNIEDDSADSEISGSVVLDEGVSIPTCDGEARGLEDFVPTATATTLEDEGEFLSFAGEVDSEGELELELLGVDTWTLGYDAETEFDTEKLVWEAEVSPTEVEIEVEGDPVDGVEYTITGVTCEAIS